MVAAHDADVLAVVERLQHGHAASTFGGECGGDVGEEADRDVGRAELELRPRVARRERQHAQIALRVAAHEGVDERGHQHGRSRVGHRQGEAALVARRLERLPVEGLAQRVERGADLGPPGFGLRRRQDAAGHCREQLVAGRLAQSTQGIAHGRLGHRELHRGPRDAALDHHRAEDAQKVEVEGAEVHGSRRGCASADGAFTAVMGGSGMEISQLLGKTGAIWAGQVASWLQAFSDKVRAVLAVTAESARVRAAAAREARNRADLVAMARQYQGTQPEFAKDLFAAASHYRSIYSGGPARRSASAVAMGRVAILTLEALICSGLRALYKFG